MARTVLAGADAPRHDLECGPVASAEDERLAREAVSGEVDHDERIRIDVRGFADLVWDEQVAEGRPEMTGQWHVHYRDGTASEPIDRQKDDVPGALEVAKDLVAR